MKLAIYPGTFDPITNGHIDIAKRAVSFCKNIIISVVKNPLKNTFFSYEERIALVKEATKNIKGISVEGFDGLVVEFARKKEVNVIVRGLRMISDF
ncbi:MAG: pantetheine-phosphate adenylyltransferase, partial [Candidatus Omnitrophica bacterium]|nr:pantetheine-phosphate adenylyltransferase [Candidatus Omnitrophota bacterium]